MDDLLTVEFGGPFYWIGHDGSPCIFDSSLGQKCGVYLWTIARGDSELVYYVGETGRTFAQRMLEHFKEHCSGGYHLNSPQAFLNGEKDSLWPGRYDPRKKTTIPEFLQRAAELWPVIVELAALYRFFLAPLQCDKRMRERIEGAIALHLYDQPGLVGGFQELGVRYSTRLKEETPVSVRIQCSRPLLGLPEHLIV